MHRLDPHARRRQARWLLGVLCGIVLHSGCTTVRRDDRTTVGVDGRLGVAEYDTYDCDGNRTSTQEHQQIGGSAHVTYEHSSGAEVGGQGTVVHGSLESSSFERPEDNDYVLWSLGAHAGFRFELFHHQLGVSLLGTDEGHLGVWPWYFLRAGALDRYWGLGQIGSPNGLVMDARLATLGGGFEEGWLRLEGGFGLGAAHLVDMRWSESPRPIQLSQTRHGDIDLLGWLELTAQAGDALDLTLGAQVGEGFAMGTLGLRVHVR